MVDELDSLIVAHEFWALFPFRRCNINKTAHFVWLFPDNDSSLKFFQLERTVVPMKLESRPWKSPNGQRKEMVFLGFPLSHVIGIWSKFDNWLVTSDYIPRSAIWKCFRPHVCLFLRYRKYYSNKSISLKFIHLRKVHWNFKLPTILHLIMTHLVRHHCNNSSATALPCRCRRVASCDAVRFSSNQIWTGGVDLGIQRME